MPRKPTQVSATNKWLRASTWLNDTHAPLVQALVMLAEAMDAESRTGKLTAATASAYRLTMADLNKQNPDLAAANEADEAHGLFGPAS